MSFKFISCAAGLTLTLLALSCENHGKNNASAEGRPIANEPRSAVTENGGTPGLAANGNATVGNTGVTNAGTVGGATGNGASAMGTGGAATNSATAGLATDTAQLSDAQIIDVLLTANTGEVTAAKLALSHATGSQAKGFAQMMIDDHSKAITQVRDLAKKKNLTSASNKVSAKLKEHSDAEAKQLTSTTNGFDAAYLQAQVEDHRTVLALLDAASGAADDNDLKALVQTLRTAVSKHLDHALSISGTSRDQQALAK